MPDRSIEELVRRDQAAYAANYPDGPSPAVLEFAALDRQLIAEDQRDLAERGHRPRRPDRRRWARRYRTSDRPASHSGADRPSQPEGRTAPEGSTTR